MSTILYSVSGEGLGHATRSEVVIKHLIKQGHKIVISCYGKSYEYFKKNFKKNSNILDIIKIFGIRLIYINNKFDVTKTFLQEHSKLRKMLTTNMVDFLNLSLKYKFDIILTDFEPSAGIFARAIKLPHINIDNINFSMKCQIHRKFASWTTNFIKSIQGGSGNYNIITTVFDVPLKKKFTVSCSLIGPIIRDSIIKNKKLKQKNHFLVYQTSQSNIRLLEILKSMKEKFIIYGFDKNKIDKNLVLKKNSINEFSKDLATCRGIITNGGYSLISEAIFLEKPIFSNPVAKQTEQEINGYYIKKFKYGMTKAKVTKKDLEKFISTLNYYIKNIKKQNFRINDFYILDHKLKSMVESYKNTNRFKMYQFTKQNFTKFKDKVLKDLNMFKN